MTVLVLARDVEPQVDRVVAELGRREVPVFRTDLAAFPRTLSLTARIGALGLDGELRTAYRCVQLSDVRSVWYRHPSHFVLDERMSRPERRHAAAEARCGIGGVLAGLDVLWVNVPSRESDALKPRQLQVAVRCGLTVPDTVVTNSRAAVAAFARDTAGPVAGKTLSGAVIAENGGLSASFTRRFGVGELDDLDALAGVESTAHLFQRFIGDKAFEVRMTVVGTHVFAAAIHAHSEAARRDFRADYPSLTYSVVDPPRGIVRGALAFLREFGLVFGAFDFAVTTSGEWIFFECNPCGQYGWLEDALDLPITSALADVLEVGSTA